MAGRRYQGPDTVLHKRLVEEEKHTSIPRAIGLGTGIGSIAWGGSRLRYLGPTLRAGKEITEPVAPGVSAVLRHAERARSGVERGTSRLGAGFGHGVGRLPQGVRDSLLKVPPELRAPTAVLAGAILVRHSRPVRHESYRPVYMPGVTD